MPNPNQEAVVAADAAVIALQGTVHSDADKVVAALEAARPTIEDEVRERFDDWCEAIDWPSCPDEHPDPKAWIEGRDAAVRAFIRNLAALQEAD